MVNFMTPVSSPTSPSCFRCLDTAGYSGEHKSSTRQAVK